MENSSHTFRSLKRLGYKPLFDLTHENLDTLDNESEIYRIEVNRALDYLRDNYNSYIILEEGDRPDSW